MMNKKIQIVSWVVLIIILAVLPKVSGTYYTNTFVTFAIFATLSVSLNMLLGYTGLLSFGQALYFGAGGYGTALALRHIDGIALIPAFGIGVLSALVLAVVISPLMSRVSGITFAMMTLAFAQFMYVLAVKFRNISGGEDGIGNFPIPAFTIPGVMSLPLKGSPENFYYFAMIVLGVGVCLMWFFTKTPFGQIQVGIRDNAKRMDYLGYKVPHSKALVYIVSGAFAGVAGSVYALFQNAVSPDGSLGALVSITPIINTVIGGTGSFFGPILGTAIYHFVEELSQRFTDRIELVMGAILVLTMMFAPTGVMGFITIKKTQRTLRKKLEKAP
jgi:branched-chain amino acid transport system permease protein